MSGAAAQPSAQPQEQPQEQPAAQLRAVPSTAQQPAQVPTDGAAPYREENVTTMRATIARRLVTSLGPIPHIFLTTEVEMDRTVEMRRQLNELDPENKVSINDFVIKVAAVALIQHPAGQRFLPGEDRPLLRARRRRRRGRSRGRADHAGRALGRIPSRSGRSAARCKELAERARNRKLTPEEYTGATFSVSNLGMFGIDEFTAIINPPEAAILAVGAMTPSAVVRDGRSSCVR